MSDSRRHITNCPTCGARLQASVRVYVDVSFVTDDNGRLTIHTPIPAFDDGDPWSDSLDLEDEENRVYCENDHDLRRALYPTDGPTL